MKRSPPKGSVSRQQPAAKRERKHTNTNTQNEIADRLLSPQVNMAHELRKLVDSANAPSKFYQIRISWMWMNNMIGMVLN